MKFYKYAGACMVSLLVLGNAYADGTIIASKAYVDSKVGDVDLSGKQDVLGGAENNGKVVVAGSTLGDVSYKAIDTTVTANSPSLITSGAVNTAVTGAVSDGSNALSLSASTTKAPSVSAVKGMAQVAASTAPTASSGRWASSSAVDNKVPTVKAVAQQFEALDATGVDGSSDAETTGNRGKPVVAVSQADGIVTAELGTVGSNGIASSAVTEGKIASNAVIGAKIKAKNVEYAKHMNNESLLDVNTGVAPATGVCIESNPCMLTYYKKDNKIFTRWTPLDTDGLSANVSVLSDGV